MPTPTVRPLRRVAVPAILVLVASAGCGAAGSVTPSPAPLLTSVPAAPATSGATARPVASPSPSVHVGPVPSGTLPWPTTFAVELASGRYRTSPPFTVPLTVPISEPGWHAGHLNPAFIDLQRYDGVEVGGFPTRMIGFGWPSNVRGGSGPVPVTGLTPGAALDLLVDRASLQPGPRAAVELLGLAGERLDLHSELENNPIFGTADGDFGLWPGLDLRLVALPLDDGLLMVAVLAPGDDLEAAWTQALAILETAELLAAT